MFKVLQIILFFGLTAGSAAASQDSIVLFDGRLHGWSGGSIAYNEEGDVIFRKENDSDLGYNFSKGKIVKEPLKHLNLRQYFLYPAQRTDVGSMIEKIDTGFYYYSRELFLVDERKWVILILNNNIVKGRWKEFNLRYFDQDYDMVFDYDYDLSIDFRGDIYLYSKNNVASYKIPKSVQHKIIIRNKIAYISLKFLLNAFNKIDECPEYIEINRDYPIKMQNCLKIFFHSLPAGDYDADTPYPIPTR